MHLCELYYICDFAVYYHHHLILSKVIHTDNLFANLANVFILFSFRLLLWEEVKPNMLEKIEDVEQPLEHILEEVKLRYLIYDT